jgi:hypothetical protein
MSIRHFNEVAKEEMMDRSRNDSPNIPFVRAISVLSQAIEDMGKFANML